MTPSCACPWPAPALADRVAVWGWVAGLTGLAAYVPYLRAACRGTTSPDPAAWAIWAGEYGLLLATQIGQHPPRAALALAALQLVGTVAVLGVVCLAGGWVLTWDREMAIVVAGVALAAWATASPAVAAWLILAAETAGMALVIGGVYRRPASEPPLAWMLFAVAGLAGIPAAAGAPLVVVAYPVMFAGLAGCVLIAQGAGIYRASGIFAGTDSVPGCQSSGPAI